MNHPRLMRRDLEQVVAARHDARGERRRAGGGARRLAGVLGPVVFVSTWAVLGQRRGDGYSPVADPISRLAAVDAPDRLVMTAGMLALAAGIGAWSSTLPCSIGRRAAQATALATVAIAVTPLGSSVGGVPHGVAAATAYATLAALPVATRRARSSTTVTSIVAALLLASIVSPSGHGLFQRAGLTLGHAWIVTRACRPAV